MSKVYFTKDITQVDKLFDAAGFDKIISKDDFVALKIHFGERGNTAYLKPQRVKAIVKKVKQCGGKPFWTDANTMYKGSRNNTLVHLQTAFDHGYTFGKTGAHVLMADGLKSKATERIQVNYKHFKVLKVASLIFEADVLISVAHFKGHDLTGFGGAIKNIGMGLGTRAGKLDMHSDCLNCAERKTCQKKKTIESCWVGSSDLVQEKITEYTAGILGRFSAKGGSLPAGRHGASGGKNKSAFINFITDVTPNCDCVDHSDPPIVPDIGILASFDPVAIDQASVDLVNKTKGRIESEDKFKTLYPDVDWSVQLRYAEEVGLGSRSYELALTE